MQERTLWQNRWTHLSVATMVVLIISSAGCVSLKHHFDRHVVAPIVADKNSDGRYYHCSHCGQIIPLEGFNKCPRCFQVPAYHGYEPTCWRQWPKGWGCPPESVANQPEFLQHGMVETDAELQELPPAMGAEAPLYEDPASDQEQLPPAPRPVEEVSVPKPQQVSVATQPTNSSPANMSASTIASRVEPDPTREAKGESVVAIETPAETMKPELAAIPAAPAPKLAMPIRQQPLEMPLAKEIESKVTTDSKVTVPKVVTPKVAESKPAESKPTESQIKASEAAAQKIAKDETNDETKRRSIAEVMIRESETPGEITAKQPRKLETPRTQAKVDRESPKVAVTAERKTEQLRIEQPAVADLKVGVVESTPSTAASTDRAKQSVVATTEVTHKKSELDEPIKPLSIASVAPQSKVIEVEPGVEPIKRSPLPNRKVVLRSEASLLEEEVIEPQEKHENRTHSAAKSTLVRVQKSVIDAVPPLKRVPATMSSETQMPRIMPRDQKGPIPVRRVQLTQSVQEQPVNSDQPRSVTVTPRAVTQRFPAPVNRIGVPTAELQRSTRTLKPAPVRRIQLSELPTRNRR